MNALRIGCREDISVAQPDGHFTDESRNYQVELVPGCQLQLRPDKLGIPFQELGNRGGATALQLDPF